MCVFFYSEYMPIHSSKKKNKNHERFDSVLNWPDVQIDKLAKGRERKKKQSIYGSLPSACGQAKKKQVVLTNPVHEQVSDQLALYQCEC